MMKRKIAAAILAGTVMTGMLSGCGEEAKAVITFRDTIIDENEYIYLLSSYKGQLLQSIGAQSDNSEIWTTEIKNDITYGDFYGALYADQIMTRAIWLQLFDEYGLELSDAQVESVDSWVSDWIEYCGGKAALNEALAIFGIDSSMMKKVKLDDLRVKAIQDYLFGIYSGKGQIQPTDEDVESCYLDTYMRTKFIRLSKTKAYDFNEDGTVKYDEEKGVFSVHDITPEEYAYHETLYSSLQEELKNGADFDTLMYRHTMESGMLYFEDGYYINSSSTIVADEVKSAVMKAEIGEWVAFETDTDWYIAKRLELLEKPYLDPNYLTTMFTALAGETVVLKQQEFIVEQNDDLVCNVDDIIGTFPLAAMTPNFYFQ